MSDGLKPCPWCEKGDMLAVSYSHYFYEVHCNRCLKAVSGDGTRASAIDAWNALPRTVQAAPSDIGDWRIDTSTDNPILTYQHCSVIQDEQAYEVMALLRSKAALSDR